MKRGKYLKIWRRKPQTREKFEHRLKQKTTLKKYQQKTTEPKILKNISLHGRQVGRKGGEGREKGRKKKKGRKYTKWVQIRVPGRPSSIRNYVTQRKNKER